MSAAYVTILTIIAAFLVPVQATANEPDTQTSAPSEIAQAVRLCVTAINKNRVDSAPYIGSGWTGGIWSNPSVPEITGSAYRKDNVAAFLIKRTKDLPSNCAITAQVVAGQEPTVTGSIEAHYLSSKRIDKGNRWMRVMQLDDDRLLVIGSNKVKPKPTDIDDGGLLIQVFHLDHELRNEFIEEMKGRAR